MSTINRGPLGSAFLINRDPANSSSGGGGSNSSGGGAATAFATESSNGPKPTAASSTAIPMPGPISSTSEAEFPELKPGADPGANFAKPGTLPVPPPRGSLVTTDLARSLSEVKGQAQFLLYLADQIEDSLHQLVEEHDDCQNAFLCRILSMYSAQLETKHHGLGDKIAETCQEVYVTVRDYDTT